MPPFIVAPSFCENKSFQLLQQLPRFAQQGRNLPSLGGRFPGEQTVLARVLVSPWRAGFRRTAMHAAALFATHRRRAARSTGADPGAATRARQHRAGIAGVVAHACASRFALPIVIEHTALATQPPPRGATPVT